MAVRLLARTDKPCKRNSVNHHREDEWRSDGASPMHDRELPQAVPGGSSAKTACLAQTAVVFAGRSCVSGDSMPSSCKMQEAMQRCPFREAPQSSASTIPLRGAGKRLTHESGDTADTDIVGSSQPHFCKDASPGSNDVALPVRPAFGPVFMPTEVAAARSLCTALKDDTRAFAISDDAPAIAINGHRIDDALCRKLNAIGVITMSVQKNDVRIEIRPPADRRPSVSSLTLPSP